MRFRAVVGDSGKPVRASTSTAKPASVPAATPSHPDPFASLSLRDLLEARDLYHWHLMNQGNVVGTAVGRYLIRTTDPWPKQPGVKQKYPRTFANSEVRDYSWPCVLVFVDDWVAESDFKVGKSGGTHPSNMVPQTLYLPDGRKVPVCVVLVERAATRHSRMPNWHWPTAYIGPGYPLLTEVQGRERRASIGCLVTDGHTTYALTNRHVCGAPGEPVYSIVGGRRVRVGVASDKQVTRLLFSQIYPELPARRTYVNLDVGLVEIDDIRNWTSRVYGLGQVGELDDLHEKNLAVDRIDEPVVAHGAASGTIAGKIKALFYRFKSVAGYDYVADFLIAPTDRDRQTEMGDSGTVWHVVDEEDGSMKPIAVEWGGQAIGGDATSGQFHFALATSLSSVCQHLDVELVRGSDVGARPYWGEIGHYSIAAFAVDAVKSRKLSALMDANRDRISFADTTLEKVGIEDSIARAKDEDFVPLADVPDIVWKKLPWQVKGGRDKPGGNGRSTGPEHPVHYADIDEPRKGDKKTLRQICTKDPSKVNVQFWQQFYSAAGHDTSSSRGLLPFRVWQFFDEMVAALQADRLDRFVCAAGILSHYVGDACQPLHGSMYADGYADRKTIVTVNHRDGTQSDVESHEGAGVHSAFETNMIDRYADDLLAALRKLAKKAAKITPITTGHAAAVATVRLMDRSAKRIPPTDLVDAYIDAGGRKVVAVYDALWEAFGDDTSKVMWDGAQVLASIWEGAWKAGGGNEYDLDALGPIALKKLRTLYQSTKFVPSLDLDAIEAELVS